MFGQVGGGGHRLASASSAVPEPAHALDDQASVSDDFNTNPRPPVGTLVIP